MQRQRTTLLFWREELAIGTHRKLLSLEAFSDASLRWVVEQAAAGPDAATIAIHPSELRPDKRIFLPPPEGLGLDPAVNPYLVADPAAVFLSNPGNIVTSDLLTLADNPWASIMIQITCTILIPRFSFVVSTHARAG